MLMRACLIVFVLPISVTTKLLLVLLILQVTTPTCQLTLLVELAALILRSKSLTLAAANAFATSLLSLKHSPFLPQGHVLVSTVIIHLRTTR